jgi:hypothetical protein
VITKYLKNRHIKSIPQRIFGGIEGGKKNLKIPSKLRDNQIDALNISLHLSTTLQHRSMLIKIHQEVINS